MLRLILWVLLRFAASALLLAYLLSGILQSDPATLAQLRPASIRWLPLILAWICFVGGVLAGICRWWLVLRALRVAAPFWLVVRYGVLSYTFDFVGLGVLGADVIKAAMLAVSLGTRQAAIAVSVLIDRVLGLYVLLTVAALANLPWLDATLPPLPTAALVFGMAANLGIAGLSFAPQLVETLAAPGAGSGRWSRDVRRLGRGLQQIRRRPTPLALGSACSIVLVALWVAGYAFLGVAIANGPAPTLVEHSRVVPLALLASILPLPADGLGALDYAMVVLYDSVSAGRVTAAQALLMVMLYRIAGVGICSLGLAFHISATVRRHRAARSGVEC